MEVFVVFFCRYVYKFLFRVERKDLFLEIDCVGEEIFVIDIWGFFSEKFGLLFNYFLVKFIRGYFIYI